MASFPNPFRSFQDVANARRDPFEGLEFKPADPNVQLTPAQNFEKFGTPEGPEPVDLDSLTFKPSVGGQEEQRRDFASDNGALQDAGRGAWHILANAVGAPVEAVNEVFRALAGNTLEQGGFMPAGDAVQFVKDTLASIGIDATPVDTIMGQIGEDAFLNLMSMGTFAAIGPALQGAGAIPKFIKGTSEAIAKNPGIAAATELGAAAGAVMGEEEGGAIGGVIGGIAGGSLAPAGRAAAREVRRATKALPPLANPLADVSATTARAGQIAQRYRQQVETHIDTIVKSVPLAGDEPARIRAADQLRQSFRNAYAQGQKGASALWAKVDETKPLGAYTDNVERLKEDLLDNIIKKNSRLAPENIPTKFIKKINALRGTDTIRDARAIRSLIEAELREGVANDTLKRHLNYISARLLDTIEEADPYDLSLKEASKYTAWLHRTFTDSPIGALIERKGDLKKFMQKDPVTAVKQFIRHSNSPDFAREADAAFPEAEIEVASRRFVDEMFRHIAEEKDPLNAAKYLAREDVRNFSKAFPRLEAEGFKVANGIKGMIDRAKAFEKSAFKRFTEMDADTFGVSIYARPDKVKVVSELARRLGGSSPGAQAANLGLKKSLVQGLLARAQADPLRARDLWNRQDNRQMLEAALDGSEIARLDRIINTAAAMVEGGESAASKFVRGTAVNLGSIIGAWTGRQLNTGTIQVPGRLANAFERVTRNFTTLIPTEELFTQAVFDPKVESYLFTRVPENLREQKQQIVNMRKALIAGSQALHTLREAEALSTQAETLGPDLRLMQ